MTYKVTKYEKGSDTTSTSTKNLFDKISKSQSFCEDVKGGFLTKKEAEDHRDFMNKAVFPNPYIYKVEEE